MLKEAHVAKDSGQRFIKRNRAPRVHIAYEDPYDADRLIELPFVMGVMADLSGNNAGVEKPEFADREFLDVDMDNFDSRMKAINPGVSFKTDNKLGDGGDKLSVNLRFEKMDDMQPAAIARQVPALATLLEAREQLANLMRYMDGKVAAEDQIKQLLADPQLMQALRERAAKASETKALEEAKPAEEEEGKKE
jgi:type VI secretion system protein ImpB